VFAYWSTQPPQFSVHPAQANYQLAQSYHPGICLVGMLDGTVHPVASSVSAAIWLSAVLPTDGQVPGADF
jgi:hypothetical protein